MSHSLPILYISKFVKEDNYEVIDFVVGDQITMKLNKLCILIYNDGDADAVLLFHDGQMAILLGRSSQKWFSVGHNSHHLTCTFDPEPHDDRLQHT